MAGDEDVTEVFVGTRGGIVHPVAGERVKGRRDEELMAGTLGMDERVVLLLFGKTGIVVLVSVVVDVVDVGGAITVLLVVEETFDWLVE